MVFSSDQQTILEQSHFMQQKYSKIGS